MMRVRDNLLSFGSVMASVFIILFLWAPNAFCNPRYDGYVSEVNSEIADDAIELVLIEKPEVLSGPTFNEKVFNHELSQEFLLRYEQVFGRTEQEDHYYLLARQGYQFMSTGVLSGTQLDSARQEFALYMAKRLIEYHGDNIMKSDPRFRAVYEVKQAVSQVNLAVTESTKFDLSYSFVGNLASFKMTNPITDFLITVTMDPQSYIPTAPSEVIVAQQKSWVKTFRSELALSVYAKVYRMTLFKDLTQFLSLNCTQTIAATQSLLSRDTGRESLSLAGLNFSF